MSDSSNPKYSVFLALGQGRRPFALAILFLAYLVTATFAPLVNYEFVDLDTPVQLLNNPTVHGFNWENVTAILAGKSTTASYYPIRALTYALDYTVWGLDPFGFKLTNIVIHLANVLLVFWLVLRLFHRGDKGLSPKTWWDALAAGFASGVFAVHPLVVEPVAWVPGREELLMVFWTLACVHCYLTARRKGTECGDISRAAMPWYVAATACCLFACLSNAVAAVVPMLVTAWDALELGWAGWKRILAGTFVLWIIGCGTIVGKQVVSQHDKFVREMDAKQVERLAEVIEELGYGKDMAVGEVPGLSEARGMLVLNVLWLNAATLAFPTQLAISYEPVVPHIQGVLLGLTVLVLFAATVWGLRKHKAALFGLLWFGLALGPTSQIMHHHIHRADRFLYLPLVGLVLTLALIVRPLSRFLHRKFMMTGVIVAGLSIVLALNAISTRQVRTWQDSITMWRQCVLIGPKNFLAQRTLADSLAKAGEYEEAYEHFEAALKMNAYNVQALTQFAGHLATNDDESQRDYELAIRLGTWANELSQWNDPEAAHTLAMVYNNYAVSLGKRGDYQQAIDYYRKAVETDREYAAPLFNLALLYTSCPDPTYHRPAEAVQLSEQACQLGTDPGANEWMILAMAYAQTGQAIRAVQTVEKAVVAAEKSGDTAYAESLRSRLALLRNQETDRPSEAP